MKRYPEYKDSGVEWIGEIPKNWEASILKRYLSHIKDGTHGSYNRVDNGYPLLSAKNVYNEGIKIDDVESYISFEDFCEITKNGFPQFGDLLVTCVGTIGRTFVYDLEKTFAFQRSVTFLRFKENSYNKYYKYFIQSDFYLNYLLSVAKTSAQSGVYMGDLERSSVLHPSIDEQVAITKFLDHKTRQIDNLIDKKQKIVELLNEERNTLINNAVTKGLDPNIPMKDSGSEWLGVIPEHWEISYLKRFCDLITDGSHFSPKSVPNGYPYITVKDVNHDKIDLINCKKISSSDYEELVRNGCRPEIDDILISKDGTIGRGIVVTDDVDFVILSSLGLIQPNSDKFNSFFLKCFLLSNICVDQMYSFIQGSALTRITIEIIKNLVVVKPPMDEQKQIITYLKEKTNSVSIMIERISKEIELISEYKTSLINEAVTGKIDVRNYQIINA